MNITIQPYNDTYKDQLISIWEKSVRTTHNFLLVSDIDYYKSLVTSIDFNTFSVFCLILENTVAGFIGIAEQKIELLFITPEHIGKGYGRRLINFAIEKLDAVQVDVNEQNQHAVSVYIKCGFATYDRKDKDSQGKDYPILKMKLKNNQ